MLDLGIDVLPVVDSTDEFPRLAGPTDRHASWRSDHLAQAGVAPVPERRHGALPFMEVNAHVTDVRSLTAG